MKQKQLGKSPTRIPAIGQGCMGIGGYLSRDSASDDAQIRSLRLGIELGMNFIDTAEAYGNGHSEELVGHAIRGMRDNVFIATKFSPEHNSFENVLKSAEASLQRLQTDYIDLYQVHWPNPRVPISETMRAMSRLLGEGKIKYVGVSNFSLKELKEAQAALPENEIVSIQVEYNLFDRSIESGILPYCEGESMTTIAYSPLDQGKVAGARRIKTLQDIADKYGKTPAQITLNWLISHSSVIAIPKAAKTEHIKENASAADFKLAEEDFTEIGRVFAQEPVRVPTDRICVVPGGQGNRPVYRTVEEALKNRLGFVPSPAELAQDIRKGNVLKPVRVIKSADKTGRYDYDLVEGRVRYWAWVIAYNGEKPVPVLLRDK